MSAAPSSVAALTALERLGLAEALTILLELKRHQGRVLAALLFASPLRVSHGVILDVSRDGASLSVDNNTARNVIYWLRGALSALGFDAYGQIETVHGHGYRMPQGLAKALLAAAHKQAVAIAKQAPSRDALSKPAPASVLRAS